MEEVDTVEENHCETLLMSIITTFDQGLRNGGGIGDFLKRVSKDHPQVRHHVMRSSGLANRSPTIFRRPIRDRH